MKKINVSEFKNIKFNFTDNNNDDEYNENDEYDENDYNEYDNKEINNYETNNYEKLHDKIKNFVVDNDILFFDVSHFIYMYKEEEYINYKDMKDEYYLDNKICDYYNKICPTHKFNTKTTTIIINRFRYDYTHMKYYHVII